MFSAVFRLCVLVALAAVTWLPAAYAQAPAKPAAQASAQAPVFKPEEIDQMVAPIALYPDPLVAQILMASTYPLEVVAAARWQKSNPGLKGKQLEDALQQLPWDPSVKSLTAFPQVLTMMDSKLDMTQKLGDAFLAQQKDVMTAIQRLRAKADQTGNLKSGKELTVEKKQEGGNTYITIEPTSPDIVYVPAYNPAVVYGAWPYPAYPPYAYYPPGYVPGAAFWGFAAGVAIGAAWNNGNCNWGSGDININNSNSNTINRGQGGGQGGGKWEHRPEHRQGAGYRDQASRDRFSGGQQRPGVDTREQFRGRAEQGRQEISKGGVSDRMAGSGGRGGDFGGRASQQPGGSGGSFGDRGGSGNRASQLPGGDRGGFGGVGGGGAQTRDFSNRGASSRSGSFSGGGGGSRGGFSGGGGGGGARGGGGGGGRGGGGGGRGGGGRR